MGLGRIGIAVAVSGLFSLSGVFAEAQEAPKPDDCAKNSCFQRSTGSISAEDIAKRGAELIRLYVEGPFDHFLTVVDITREPTGIIVLDARTRGRLVGEGEIVHPLSQNEWDGVVSKWRQFERDDAEAMQRHEEKLREMHARGEDEMCLMESAGIGWDVVLQGQVTHAEPDACYSDPADAMLEKDWTDFLRLVPFCKDVPVTLRQGCFVLDGDRFAAARVLEPMDRVDRQLFCKSNTAIARRPLAPALIEAAHAWQREAHADSLDAEVCRVAVSRSLIPAAIEGEGDTVTVTGQYWIYGEDYVVRSYRQVWQVRGSEQPVLQSWDVSAPVRVER